MQESHCQDNQGEWVCIGSDHANKSHYFSRFFFDNLINILLVFIIINMLAGKLIATPPQLPTFWQSASERSQKKLFCLC